MLNEFFFQICRLIFIIVLIVLTSLIWGKYYKILKSFGAGIVYVSILVIVFLCWTTICITFLFDVFRLDRSLIDFGSMYGTLACVGLIFYIIGNDIENYNRKLTNKIKARNRREKAKVQKQEKEAEK